MKEQGENPALFCYSNEWGGCRACSLRLPATARHSETVCCDTACYAQIGHFESFAGERHFGMVNMTSVKQSGLHSFKMSIFLQKTPKLCELCVKFHKSKLLKNCHHIILNVNHALIFIVILQKI